MTEPLVYFNDELIPATQARLAIYDAGVVLGATVTDMIRTFHKQLYRLEDHLDRFARSLRFVRFDVDVSMGRLAEVAKELVTHNARLAHADDEFGLVFFATAGEISAYAAGTGRAAREQPTLCAHTFPLSFERFAEFLDGGQHVITPSIRHVPPQCLDPKMKYRSRLHYYLADQEVRQADPRAIALLLDVDGNVTETSGANFMFVEDGKIVTPTTRNTLPGVSRTVVSELAAKLGIGFEERDFQVFNVVNADEAFTASTPYCLLPVTRINHLPIGDGAPGKVFETLINAWSDEVGLNIRQQIVDGAKRRGETK